jgi:hypothetical protein
MPIEPSAKNITIRVNAANIQASTYRTIAFGTKSRGINARIGRPIGSKTTIVTHLIFKKPLWDMKIIRKWLNDKKYKIV